MVVENGVGRGVEARSRHFLRDGEADGIRHALPERTGGTLDAGGFKGFGMAGSEAAERAEIPDLPDGHFRITREMEPTVKGTSTHGRRRAREAVAVFNQRGSSGLYRKESP